jgi:hypothetical protein
VRRHILVAVCLIYFWFASGLWAQTSIKSSDRPVYDNRPYGYMVTLPRDLTYTRTSPPNPDHGVGIDLRSRDKLWVDASYTDSSTNEEEAAVITTGCRIDDKRTSTLGGRIALSLRFTCPASADQKAYTELVTLVIHRQGDRSPADYQVGLRVYGSDVPTEERTLFDRVVVAFRFTK